MFANPGLDSSFSMITPVGVVTTTIAPGSAEGSGSAPNGILFGICAGEDGKMYIPVSVFRQAGAVGYVISVS